MNHRRNLGESATNTATSLLGGIEMTGALLENLASAGNNLAIAANNRSAIYTETSTLNAELHRDKLLMRNKQQRMELDAELEAFTKSIEGNSKKK